jgi:hypothetical protein
VKIASGTALAPRMLVKAVQEATGGWSYDVVSIRYPGPVVGGRPLRDQAHLGKGPARSSAGWRRRGASPRGVAAIPEADDELHMDRHRPLQALDDPHHASMWPEGHEVHEAHDAPTTKISTRVFFWRLKTLRNGAAISPGPSDPVAT